MSNGKKDKVSSNDRAMQEPADDRSQVFFFPKRNPPVSVRAASREEAEKLVEDTDAAALSTPNQQEA